MTDDQVEQVLWKEIRGRDITIHDMIGLPCYGVDPHPEDDITPRSEKGIRSNRFESFMGGDRMKELLCVGEYTEWDDDPPLKIPLQDLFRFWWNRCVDRYAVVDAILEDIFSYFTEQMRPPEKEKKSMDVRVDFDQIPVSGPV